MTLSLGPRLKGDRWGAGCSNSVPPGTGSSAWNGRPWLPPAGQHQPCHVLHLVGSGAGCPPCCFGTSSPANCVTGPAWASFSCLLPTSVQGSLPESVPSTLKDTRTVVLRKGSLCSRAPDPLCSSGTMLCTVSFPPPALMDKARQTGRVSAECRDR